MFLERKKASELTKRMAMPLLQLAGFSMIFFFVPTSLGKLIGFSLIWMISLWPFSLRRVLTFFSVGILFGTLDAIAVSKNLFFFTTDEFLGLPWYEWFMWGFYLLHTYDVLGAKPYTKRHSLFFIVIIACLYALPFMFAPGHIALIWSSFFALAALLLLLHEHDDIRYACYFAALGTAVEITGVFSQAWGYSPEAGLIPLWYIPLWAGSGLLLRRIFIPILHANQDDSRTKKSED